MKNFFLDGSSGVPEVHPTVVPGAKLFILAEAPGKTEVEQGRPLVGASGSMLNGQLARAGISRDDCSVGNVLRVRPPDSKLEHFLCPRRALPKNYTYPSVSQGKYLMEAYLPQVEQMLETVRTAKPNLVLALGNLACWALLRKTGITKLRGFIHESTILNGTKVLPTFHPAAIFKQHEIWPYFAFDIQKAAREMHSPIFKRPKRFIHIPETVHDIDDWYDAHEWRVGQEVGCDIETKKYGDYPQITCIGFSPSPSEALVIPIAGEHNGSYWQRSEDELQVWRFIRRMLNKPLKFIFHNGLYDLSYLCYLYKIPFRAEWHDTMIVHHAMQPEMRKGLGFLGSLYTEEADWKLMRIGDKGDEKPDDDD